MRKYLHVLGLGVQNTLVYRLNFLFRATLGLVPLMGTLFVWQAVYAGQGETARVGAYTLGEMISYYLLVTLVDALTAVAEDDWQIAADIKDGRISSFLLQPVDYLTYRFCLYLSGRAVYTTVALVPVSLFLLHQRQHLVLPPDAWTAAAAGISVVMAAGLQFLTAYTMALLAFWVLDVSTFIFIQFAFEYLASGHLFPLDVLPPAAARAIQLTPYPYMLYFPVSVGLGRVRGDALWQGLLVQAAWVVVAFGLARWMWHRGVRRYAAVGG
ncbi:MAG: ABC transporter permease [Verrucomicrobiota bacterium]